MFQTESTQDWCDQLPVEVQESIREGLKDAEEGNVFTHDQVMNEAREKYGFCDEGSMVCKSTNNLFLGSGISAIALDHRSVWVSGW